MSIPRLAWARCRLAMCRSTRHRPLSGVSLLQGIMSLTARIAGRPRASFAALMLSRASSAGPGILCIQIGRAIRPQARPGRGAHRICGIASGDEQLGYVYLPMGNAAADYYSSLRRPPENFYATSLVALEVTTGKPVWRFQAVKKDVWD